MAEQQHGIGQRGINTLAWTLLAFAIGVPFIAWAGARGWRLNHLSAFQLFPLLGMWAWLTMWSHYVVAAVRLRAPGTPKAALYSTVSAYAVLACILLHPLLLITALYKSGAGWPPGSLREYVAAKAMFAVWLGLTAWVVFISYEFFMRLKEHPAVKRYWGLISLSQALALGLVFWHARRLGQHLQSDWLHSVWLACLIVFVASASVVLRHDLTGGERIKRLWKRATPRSI